MKIGIAQLDADGSCSVALAGQVVGQGGGMFKQHGAIVRLDQRARIKVTHAADAQPAQDFKITVHWAIIGS